MPQELHIVKCFSCSTYQVDIVKKSKKWCCKLCGEKQSLKQVFGRGSGKECREQVQKLTDMQRNSDTSSSLLINTLYDNDKLEFLNETPNSNSNSSTLVNMSVSNSPKQSKWVNFIDESKDENETETEELINKKSEFDITKELPACSNVLKRNSNFFQPQSFVSNEKSCVSPKPIPLLNFHQKKINRPISKQRPVPYSKNQSTSKQLFNYEDSKQRNLKVDNELPSGTQDYTKSSIAQVKSDEELKRSKWENFIYETNEEHSGENRVSDKEKFDEENSPQKNNSKWLKFVNEFN